MAMAGGDCAGILNACGQSVLPEADGADSAHSEPALSGNRAAVFCGKRSRRFRRKKDFREKERFRGKEQRFRGKDFFQGKERFREDS